MKKNNILKTFAKEFIFFKLNSYSNFRIKKILTKIKTNNFESIHSRLHFFLFLF